MRVRSLLSVVVLIGTPFLTAPRSVRCFAPYLKGRLGLDVLVRSPKDMSHRRTDANAQANGGSTSWKFSLRQKKICQVSIEISFDWANYGQTIRNWKLERTMYYSICDRRETQIVDPGRLGEIESVGIGRMLIDLAISDAKRGTWFERPARNGHGDTVVALFADDEPHVSNMGILYRSYISDLTPLMRAVMMTDRYSLKELLKSKSDLNAFNSKGWTALTLAAGAENDLDILSELIDAGADIDANPNRNGTALLWAVGAGRPENVKALLQAGANPNITNAKGETPLSIARREQDLDIVNIFRNAGVKN